MTHPTRPASIIVHADIDARKLTLARTFRRAPTPAEAAAWQILRNRGLFGLKFRRQQVIAGFIVDFYCSAARLALELDGVFTPTLPNAPMTTPVVRRSPPTRSASCASTTTTSTSRDCETCSLPMPHLALIAADLPSAPLSLVLHPEQPPFRLERAGPGRGAAARSAAG